MSDVKYLSINSPTLTLKLAGKRYSAVNGVFPDMPPEAIADMEKLLKLPHIRSEVRKVDMDEAARKAQEYLKTRPQAAVRGVVTSSTQATAILRDAKRAQETQPLTGVMNPVNVSTKPDQSKPVEVTELQTQPPKPGSLSKAFKH